MRFCQCQGTSVPEQKQVKQAQTHKQTLDYVRTSTIRKVHEASPPTASAGSGSNNGSSGGSSSDRSRCMKPECCQDSTSCMQQG